MSHVAQDRGGSALRLRHCGVGGRWSVLAFCLLASGCLSPSNGSRSSRHFHAEPWMEGADAQVEHADRFVPELFLLAAIPVGVGVDSDVAEDTSGTVPAATQFRTDATTIGMGALATAVGIRDWIGGDEG